MFIFCSELHSENPLWNKQVCPKLINVMIENNLSHKSGAKSSLCNVAIKESPLLSHIFICICPFFLPWRDVRTQLQCFYPYIIKNLESNWKPLVSCGTLLHNPNKIGQLWTVTTISTGTFFITRHTCHRWIYLLVTVIFAVVACTIKMFIKMCYHEWEVGRN